MSSKLWEYFIQDDVERFQQFLANATFAGPRAAGGTGNSAAATTVAAVNLSSKAGSPGSSIASSPNPPKPKKAYGLSPGPLTPERIISQRGGTTISRADVNARDHYGRTLLHHIASSSKTSAICFARALLQVPFLDIYAQDWESGWTALHRALYAGNASIALALMARDVRDVSDFNKLGYPGQPSGTLVKIKDREGYSPFDVYGATITSRDIKQMTSLTGWPGSMVVDNTGSDIASNAPSSYEVEFDEGSYVARGTLNPHMDFSADEAFTLGSNKNLNLGLGDQDDRQYPERITLTRSEHLLHRFHREYLEHMGRISADGSIDTTIVGGLPTLIENKPIKIRNVSMSKLHTAVITDDPEANLFMCGFGPGGRLGTGDESTQFTFTCIETGGLAGKKVIAVALGQDHSLAITQSGEIFSWGSNKFGQLGYSLPRTSSRNDVPIQTTPRQIFNPFKRETILGAAASSIHSVVFSNSGLYTFGKNEGQLGLVDSDARSLEIQATPRRVGASLFSCSIQMVSAIDRATAVLLQNHEVWVFSQYGYSKLSFPLEATSRFIRDSFMTTRYDASINRIVKLTCGGNTICALSRSGDVFTVEVNQSDIPSALTSTTNPSKIRNSLAAPVRAWSVKKSHMAASDVDVGHDGSIIICTTSGSAWRKEKRTKKKEGASKEYKFVRIPGLSRVVAVRSNAFGAYAVAQRDCDVTREQVHVDPSSLWDDFLPLSPFLTPDLGDIDSIIASDGVESIMPVSSATAIKRAILSSPDMESRIMPLHPSRSIWITTSSSSARIPVHEFLLTGRSPILQKALPEFRQSYYYSIPDVLDIGYDRDGCIQINLQEVDFMTAMNLTFFLYTDSILDVWHKARGSPENATRYRQVRTEVMRIATQLGLPTLERAARLMVEPQRSLKSDMAFAIQCSSFFNDADLVVQLNDCTVRLHSEVVCQRCPFFDALFHGRSGGKWIAMRRTGLSENVKVDLQHIDRQTFNFVLRYLYADTEDEMFDEVRTKSLDDLLDLLLDVMYVANELMIDRLSQICQKMLGRFVNTRNIAYLLNSVAPIYVREFKEAALEYICLNFEAMLVNRYMEDLDEDLLKELDKVCHENQLACYPVSRGRNSEEYAFEKYPELITSIENDKRRRIDAIALQSRLRQEELYDPRTRPGTNEKVNSSPSIRKAKAAMSRDLPSSRNSPMLKPRQSSGDLMFQMDEEATPDDLKGKCAARGVRFGGSTFESQSHHASPTLGTSIPDIESPGDRSFLDNELSSPRDDLLAQSPSEARAIAIHNKRAIASPPDTSSVPWGSTVISNDKKDFKDIMGEASQTRVSNLTLNFSGRRESSGNFTSKVSQKERKKIQQQQLQDQLAAQRKAKETSRNPWQLPPPATPSTPGKGDTIPGRDGPSQSASQSAKAAPKPAMTMRQTVAGTPPPRSKHVATPVQSPNSNPFPPNSISSQQNQLNTSQQPAIQSIRHIPPPDLHSSGSRSASHSSLSLATILLQQQTEKDEIREAATAKHNLQDIQAEQEFQQWWDQESKRVQGLLGLEEPPQRDDKANRGGKASGASRRRRGNKHGGPDGATQGQKHAPSSNSGPSKKNATGLPPARPQGNAAGTQVSRDSATNDARRTGHGSRRSRGRGRG